MHPEMHEEFVALCALYTSGELTDEEWALLQVHLAYCESCQRTFEEYRQLAEQGIPALAAAHASAFPSSTAFSIDASEQRLLRSLEDVPEEGTLQSSSVRKRWLAVVLATAAVLALMAFVSVPLYKRTTQVRRPPVAQAPVATAPMQTAHGSSPESTKASIVAPVAAPPQRLESSVREEALREATEKIAGLEAALRAEQQGREALATQRDDLTRQLASLQTQVEAQRDSSAQNLAQTAQLQARAAELEAKLRAANDDLAEKDRMLTLDKGFLAHDREIRDLIGARDLYIADIFDVHQNGETAKPFGRIFYTRDRSLVFYGYDLDKQAGIKRAVTFQAWGSGEEKQNVSLGLFYQDDTHRRWVLTFNDAKTLAHLNRVFVTAEPQGGSSQPTGKPLLLAYLQVKANHP